MKKTLSAFFLLLSIQAFSQLHQSILIYLNDLPAFPHSYSEAGAKCRNLQNACTTDTICSHFFAIHTALFTQLNSTMPATNISMPDTSLARKVQQMTPEQQQAWAMQFAMQQQHAAGQPLKVPNADELTFSKKYGELTGTQNMFSDSISNGWKLLTDDFDAHLKSLNEKRVLQIEKCPVVNSGNEPGPSRSCLKQAEKDYQDGLATYYSEWQVKAGNFIASKKTALQGRYSGLEALLVKTNYMSNASQPSFTTEAIGLQQCELASEMTLNGMIGELWGHGCDVEWLISQSKLRV
ncbi:hypothetical protein BH11BAC7_BH11BAC7_18960 [soil metagenome]